MHDRNVVLQCLGSLRIPNILKTKLRQQMPGDDKMVMKRLTVVLICKINEVKKPE